MGLFDRRRPPRPPEPPPPPAPEAPRAPEGPFGAEKLAAHIGVTLLALEDPYETDVVNSHCSEAYKLGEERLVALEVLLRNNSRTERATVSGSKFHAFDDAHYQRPSVVLDSRIKQPALIEGFLLPGAVVRGWVTFLLPWDRQIARVQFFTGYLGDGVVAFDLALSPPEALAQRRAEARERRARGEVSQAIAARRREVGELEARASAAAILLERADEVRALEARAEQARREIARAEELLARLGLAARRADAEDPDDDRDPEDP